MNYLEFLFGTLNMLKGFSLSDDHIGTAKCARESVKTLA